MPEWMTEGIIIALIGVGGIILGLLGSLITVKLTAKKNKTDLQLALMNEIQEERNRLDEQLKELRVYHDAQMTAQQERHDKSVKEMNIRITGFYVEKSKSRRYIADLENDNALLRLHINQGKSPPPPTPVPVPPEGYVP